MSIALRPDLKDRLDRFRRSGGTINVSKLCSDAIAQALDRQQGGNRLVERLKVELTERRGTDWTAGYQEGRRWAEERASWREITDYGTRYSADDVRVRLERAGQDITEPGMYEYEWLAFAGLFCPPVEDYGQDSPVEGPGAPAYTEVRVTDGERVWQTNPARCERHWRGWLAAVVDVYASIENQLPSVADSLPPLPAPVEDHEIPTSVDPDDIPF